MLSQNPKHLAFPGTDSHSTVADNLLLLLFCFRTTKIILHFMYDRMVV